MKKVFIVEDKFEIEGRGIALTGVTEDDTLKLAIGEIAIIKQKKLPEISAEVLGFELMRNCWSPHKPRNMCLLLSSDIGINNIELKSEVWGGV